MNYTSRIADAELRRKLSGTGAVLIEGPKACGKTETARQIAASEVLLDVDVAARRALAIDPSLVLEGPTPRLLDEWQVEPTIWNHVRRAVDDRQLPGQFVLTGSAVPADDVTRHTGAGRITRLRMRPMTLFESGHSDGSISLAGLLGGGPARANDAGITVAGLAERITVGGWPAHLGRSVTDALQSNLDYLDEVRRVDVNHVDGVRRDPNRVGRTVASLARNVATHASATAIAADASGVDGSVDRETVSDYLNALERLMIVEEQPAWSPHLRSRSVPRSAPKRHFVDPSLAVAALRAGPDRLLRELNLLGLLFESMVVRDLRVYAQESSGRVLQYRDNTGLEVDAIVETSDDRWGAFEVKLGAGLVDEGADSLLRFADRIDTAKCGPPAVLGVIVGTGYGYVRPDGIAVVPIGSLGP